MLFERANYLYTAMQRFVLPEFGEYLTGLVLPLKQGIVLFWAVWLSVAFFANAFDGLKALKIMRQGWRFASGNYALMTETTRKYHFPAWCTGLLFLGVVLWQGLSALLFWYAFSTFHGMRFPGLRTLDMAFLVSLALWAAFMIADEIFMAYDAEATHMRIFIAQLLSLLVLHLLPE
jgi:hypothetical protein